MASGKLFGADGSKTVMYRAGKAKVTMDVGGGAKDAVFLQVDISVSRQLSPIATLGQGIHWSAQPPSGQLQAQTIVTNSTDLVNALASDECKKATINLNLEGSSCSTDGTAGAQAVKKITIDDGFCSQIGFSMSGQQGYIGSNLVVMFTSCSVN